MTAKSANLQSPPGEMRERMLAWFKSQGPKGYGSFTCKNENSDAERTNSLLQNVASLLWIAEAVGIDADTVEPGLLLFAARKVALARYDVERVSLPPMGTWSMSRSATSPKGLLESAHFARGRHRRVVAQVSAKYVTAGIVWTASEMRH